MLAPKAAFGHKYGGDAKTHISAHWEGPHRLPPTGYALAHVQIDIGEATGAAAAALVTVHTHTWWKFELGKLLCLSLPLQLQCATLAVVSAGSSWHRHRSDAGLAVLPRLIRSNTAQKVRGSTEVQKPNNVVRKGRFLLCATQSSVQQTDATGHKAA